PLAAGDALEPFEVGVTWWRRIDHLAAAHRCLRSEHDPVAALRDDRRGEAELRESPGADDAPESRARAVVDKRAFRNRRELLQRDVEPVAGRVCAGCDERVTAPQVVPLDSGQGNGDALAGLG